MGIKVVKNGEEGVADVVFPVSWQVVGKSLAALCVPLIAAGIIGNIAMYREVGETKKEAVDTNRAVLAIADALERERQRSVKEDELLKLNLEIVKRRLTLLDKKLD